MVDTGIMARTLQGVVGHVGPVLPGLFKPCLPPAGDVGLLATPSLGGLGVVPLEPLLSVALDAVVQALGNHQVAVGVLALAAVDRQRVGQLLVVGEVLGEVFGQRLALVWGQLSRQREFDLTEQHPIGAFVSIRSVPVVAGTLDPIGHVARLGVLDFILVAGIPAFALDVVGFGACRLAALPAASRSV